jgi:hypothetical protein
MTGAEANTGWLNGRVSLDAKCLSRRNRPDKRRPDRGPVAARPLTLLRSDTRRSAHNADGRPPCPAGLPVASSLRPPGRIDRGRWRREQRIQLLHDVQLAADHLAEAALEPSDAVTGAGIHRVNGVSTPVCHGGSRRHLC